MSTSDQEGARKSAWRELSRRIGFGVGLSAEQTLSAVRDRFDARFRPDRPVHIVAYRGHANDSRTTVSCRVLRYHHAPDNDPATLWAALAASYRRFETDELPNTRVQLQLAEATHMESTDDEGYAHFDVPTPAGASPELAGILSLPDMDTTVSTTVDITRPSANATFGVISDIDDTVLVTEATSILRMMRLTLLSSGASRVAFDGVGAFYRALVQGGSPMFYVSSSPWNLYEFLTDFLATRGLPVGPLFLRDFGLSNTQLVAGPHAEHKLGAIRAVLDRHQHLSFVLIGDSGQRDPEIYRQIVETYPGRILAIYIRDVSEVVRDEAVREHIAALDLAGVPMLLVPDTQAAATHAVSIGLIEASVLDDIASDVQADRAPNVSVDAQPEL